MPGVENSKNYTNLLKGNPQHPYNCNGGTQIAMVTYLQNTHKMTTGNVPYPAPDGPDWRQFCPADCNYYYDFDCQAFALAK